MRALKVLVVVMGIVIVIGFTALVVIIAGRLSRGGTATAPVAPTAPVELPSGARIETIGVGADRIVLDLLLPDGKRELLVIDLASGRRLVTIPLRPAP